MQPGPFGPFALLEPLAKGGMGEVWLARRFGLKNVADVVVVKVTRSDQAARSDTRQRFLDETRIALLLAHPCIARTVDAGRAEGMEFLALEAVDGISLLELEQRMEERHEPLPEHVALYVAASMLDGLAFAHTATHPITHAPLAVVHRDISPHNVMLASDGAVKIIDFGVALSSLKEAQTEQGIVVGKMAYMSPEQARGSPIDARADVFAVAVVLYEMLAGERFYPGMSPDAIWRVAGTGQYVPPRLAEMAPDVRRVLARALHPDPAQRTSSASSMRAEVAALLMVRGGAMRSARDTAALVQRHAGEEIARMARARVAAQRLSEERGDTTTESIASAEGIAIDAALRAQEGDPLTVRLETYASLPVVDAPLDEPERVATPHTVIVPRQADPRTVVISRDAASDATRPPARSPPPRRGPSAVAIAAGGIAVVAMALAVGFAWGATRVGVVAASDAGAPIVVVAADAGPPIAVVAADAGAAVVDAGAAIVDAGAAVVDAGSPRPFQSQGTSALASRRARLAENAKRLERCSEACAKYLRSAIQGNTAKLSEPQVTALEGRLRSCQDACKR